MPLADFIPTRRKMSQSAGANNRTLPDAIGQLGAVGATSASDNRNMGLGKTQRTGAQTAVPKVQQAIDKSTTPMEASSPEQDVQDFFTSLITRARTQDGRKAIKDNVENAINAVKAGNTQALKRLVAQSIKLSLAGPKSVTSFIQEGASAVTSKAKQRLSSKSAAIKMAKKMGLVEGIVGAEKFDTIVATAEALFNEGKPRAARQYLEFQKQEVEKQKKES